MPAQLVLDIETIGDAANRAAVAEMAAAAGKEPAEFAALSPALARVVCVGMRDLTTKREMAFVDLSPFKDCPQAIERARGFASERELLEVVNSMFLKVAALVTFNGRAFDVPVLVHRMVAWGIRPASFLMACARQPRYKGAGAHVDLREQFTFAGACNGPGTSLRAFALGYGFNDPKAGGDGAEVEKLIAAGNAQGLVDYCLGDVAAAADLFERWCQLVGVA
jgi:hypothetical protein